MKYIFKIIIFAMALLTLSPIVILCSLLSFILWDKKYIETSISWVDTFLESIFD